MKLIIKKKFSNNKKEKKDIANKIVFNNFLIYNLN